MRSIIFLHGWGKSGETMQLFASLFREKGYTTYTPDLPGFGSAEPPIKPWNVDDYVEWFKQYLDEKKLSRVILITQSFGGRVAIKFAVKYPQYLEKLIMMGAPGIKEKLSWKRWMLKLAIRFGKWWFMGVTWEVLLPWPIRKYIERKLSRLDYFRVQGVMRATLTKVVNEDLHSCLKKITTSTLLVWGEHDEFVPLYIGQAMEKEISGAKLVVIPDAKHGIYRTHPDFVAQEIFCFL